MRFKKYLNEQKELTIKEALENIKKECQPFLKDLKKASPINNLLYSGRKEKTLEAFRGTVRKNRVPKDTPLSIHNWLDSWFEENFGIKARSNSLMAVGDTSVAKGYGNLYAIFPIGNYEIIWSPEISDLYTEFRGSNISWDIITTDINKSAPYMEHFFKDIKSDWTKEYGEHSGNGKWVYNNGQKRITYGGEWLKHEIAMDLMKKPDLPDDRDEIKEDIYWIPEVKWEEYRNQKLKEMKEREIEKAKNFLSSYQKNELKKAINSRHEIMIITSEYYALTIDDVNVEFMVRDWLRDKFEINWKL